MGMKTMGGTLKCGRQIEKKELANETEGVARGRKK
jgi:hypothetical protein